MNWPLYICGGSVIILSGLLACFICRNRRWRRLADNRLRLLRRIIDLSYLYKEQPLKFMHRFCDAIKAPALQDARIVPMPRPARSKTDEEARFLMRLLDAGFSRKEICAIFELKSINCLYVKFHRAKKKLAKEEKHPKRTNE